MLGGEVSAETGGGEGERRVKPAVAMTAGVQRGEGTNVVAGWQERGIDPGKCGSHLGSPCAIDVARLRSGEGAGEGEAAATDVEWRGIEQLVGIGDSTAFSVAAYKGREGCGECGRQWPVVC
jgi:hypothetical protein